MKKVFLSFLVGVFGFASFLDAKTSSPDIYTYNLGEVKVHLLSEGQNEGKTALLIGANETILKEYAPNGTFKNAVNAFLIQTPNENILVDSGFGRKLFDNLKTLGVKAEDINKVLVTHMHGDHIGGLLKDKEKTFKNAKVFISKPEAAYWGSDEEKNKLPVDKQGGFLNAKNVLEIYKNDITLFEPNELNAITNKLFGDISAVAAFGHTPGHTMFLVENKGEKLLIWADLTHAMQVQMPYPSVAIMYDVNPEEAVKSRKAVLEFVAKNKIPVAGMHISFPSFGTINKVGNGYQFTPVK
ncbi:MAG: MBL fold metallo-hydrolase [Campylobacteraceae bacterium]